MHWLKTATLIASTIVLFIQMLGRSKKSGYEQSSVGKKIRMLLRGITNQLNTH